MRSLRRAGRSAEQIATILGRTAVAIQQQWDREGDVLGNSVRATTPDN